MIDAAANNPPTSGASSVQMRMRRQRQRTIVEFDEHMKRAHELSLQEKWAPAEQEVINAVDFGRNAPLPQAEQAYEDLYA